jgi:hypothetical protein
MRAARDAPDLIFKADPASPASIRLRIPVLTSEHGCGSIHIIKL